MRVDIENELPAIAKRSKVETKFFGVDLHKIIDKAVLPPSFTYMRNDF